MNPPSLSSPLTGLLLIGLSLVSAHWVHAAEPEPIAKATSQLSAKTGESDARPSPSQSTAASSASDASEGPEEKAHGFGALPAINYNTDEGFGYGAITKIFWYDPAKKDIQPYSAALTLRIFLTTKWVQAHLVELDALDVADLPVRLRVRGVYYSSLVDNFCGVGAAVTCDPTLAEASALDAFGVVDPAELSTEDGLLYDDMVSDYYKMRYTEPYLWVDTRTKLRDLPHKVEVMASWRGSYFIPGTLAEPSPYPGSLLEATPDRVPSGRLSVLQAGIMMDNRDFEPAPTRGYWIEASARAAHGLTGSEYTYAGLNTTLRGYVSLLPEGRLVAAERIILDGIFGDVPAPELQRVGGSGVFSTYGGQNAGRGIRNGRYLGRLKTISQSELRFNAYAAHIGEGRLDLGTLAFLDAGLVGDQVFDPGEDALTPLVGTGGGLRIAWNRTFIVRVDVGVSPIEDWGPRVYINLDNLF